MSYPKRNKFNLSHSVKTTCNMGELIPVLMHDVLPNDRYRLNVQSLIRLAPLLAPSYSEIDVQFHFFFVPNRLIWSKWEDFITQSHNGRLLAEEDLPQPPVFRFTGDVLNSCIDDSQFENMSDPVHGISHMQAPLSVNSLADHLGFQVWPSGTEFSNVGIPYDLDQMPFRAYYKVWSDYFRDENLMEDELESIVDESGVYLINPRSSDGIIENFLQLKYRAWKKDYFTSALPFAQKGDEVLIPVSSGDGKLNRLGTLDQDFVSSSSLNGAADSLYMYNNASPVGNTYARLSNENNNNFRTFNINPDNFGVQLDGASAGTIRELRRAMAAQRFLEKRAIGGSRYIEQNLTFFGARSSDGRLQRAQFLGGYKMPVMVNQLLQTSESTDSSPLGSPAGNAYSSGSSFIFDKNFEEYGWLVGLMSIRPKADYMQGIPKKYLRKDIYDYYWPPFSQIGEQPIQNQELYYDPESENNDGTFGYTPRYAEYRFCNNRICGDFKSSLKFWTLARDFSDIPNLNASFITCDPSNRIFAVESSDFKHFWCDIYFDIQSLRPLPKYATS